jgi:hypothetical protein
VQALRCENRKNCLTAYRNVDFAPLSQGNLTCPECGSPLLEHRKFTSSRQTLLVIIQLTVLIIGVLCAIFLKEEAIELYQKIRHLFA